MHTNFKFNCFCFKFLTYIFFFLFAPNFAIAQKSNNEHIDHLLDKAWGYHDNGQLTEVVKSSLDILSQSISASYDKGIGQSNWLLADALFNIGLFQEGFKYLEEVTKTKYFKERPIVQSEVYRIEGRAYRRLKLYKQALNAYSKQSKLFDKLDPEKAKISKLYLYGNLIYLFGGTNQLDSIEKYSELQMNLVKEFSEKDIPLSYVNAHIDMGYMYINNKDYQKAITEFDKSIALAQKYNVPMYFNAYLGYAKVEEERGNYEKAISHYEKSLVYVKKIGEKDALRDQYEQLASFYRTHKIDDRKANEYLIAYNKLRDSLETENREVIDITMGYILKAKENQDNHSNTFWIVGGLLGLFLLLLLYSFWKTRKSSVILSEKETVLDEQKTLNATLSEAMQENKFQNLIALAKGNNPEFLMLFTELYPGFIAALKALDPKIRNTELEFCAMAYLNFSTKNIAEYTFVTVRAVQVRKNRLRKKLGIPSDVDFNIWMSELTLDK